MPESLTDQLYRQFGSDRQATVAALEAIAAKRKEESFVRYWQPFAYEMKAFEALDEGTKILVIAGGNRSGKTEVGAAITVAYAEGKKYFEGDPAWEWVSKLTIPEKRAKNIWIVGLDYKVLQNVIWREKLLTGTVHPGMLPKDDSVSNVREADKQIFMADGTVITGMSADAGREKFQSASVDLIWIDEECDAEIFDECYQRTIDCGGKIIVTVTPLIDIASGIKTPWIFNLYEDMKAGRKDIKFVNLSVLDNPIVSQEEKDRLCEKWKGHPEERARLYGEFVRRSGLVYPMWDRKVHVKRTNPPQEWKRYVSIDPAATGVTAAIFAAIDGSNNIHVYREYYDSNQTVGEHVRNIEAMRRGDSIDIWLIDPKWGSQRNAETHRTGQQLYRDAGGPGRGLPVRLAEVGEDYGLLASMEYLQATSNGASDRHPKVWIDPSCVNFIDEIEHYTWAFFQRGDMKGLSKDKPMKRNDHLMNAFQYLAAQKPRSKMWMGYKATDDEAARLRTNSSYF